MTSDSARECCKMRHQMSRQDTIHCPELDPGQRFTRGRTLAARTMVAAANTMVAVASPTEAVTNLTVGVVIIMEAGVATRTITTDMAAGIRGMEAWYMRGEVEVEALHIRGEVANNVA